MRSIAADTSSWIAGGPHGQVYTSESTYLGCGEAVTLAGAAAGDQAAIATTAGRVLLMDTATQSFTGEVDVQAQRAAAMSASGAVFAIENSSNQLNVIRGGSMSTAATSFSISSDGTHVAVGVGSLSTGCSRAVYVLGGSQVYSDTGKCPPLALSPSGTYVAATDVFPQTSSTTFIYQGSNFVSAVPGYAIGWIDDDRLLVEKFTNSSPSSGPPTGSVLASQTGVGNVIYDNQERSIDSVVPRAGLDRPDLVDPAVRASRAGNLRHDDEWLRYVRRVCRRLYPGRGDCLDHRLFRA